MAVAKLIPWPFYPREITPVSIKYEAGWAAETIWGRGGGQQNLLLLREFEARSFQPAVQSLYRIRYSCPKTNHYRASHERTVKQTDEYGKATFRFTRAQKDKMMYECTVRTYNLLEAILRVLDDFLFANTCTVYRPILCVRILLHLQSCS
jgi:hypothetical protein